MFYAVRSVRVGGVAVLTIATVVLALVAQPSGAQTWSFDEISQQAMLGHPAILTRKSSAAAALADIETANWQRYPTPAVSASKDGKGDSSSLLSVQQPLWTGGRITSDIAAAQSRYGASEKAVNESRQDVQSRIISAYVDAVRWQVKRTISEKNAREHEQLLEMINRRVDVEASPAVDRELAQARLYQASNDLSAAKLSLSNALTQLSQLAGKEVEAVWPLTPDENLLPPSKESAIEQALFWSPALARISFEGDAAAADIGAKRSAYWPQLALRYENQHGTVTDRRMMVVLDTQFGAGLSAEAGVKAAVAKREAARLAYETATRDVRQQVSMDWDEWEASRMRLNNASKASISSREVFDSYTRQYTAGRKSWLDVLNSVREVSTSEFTAADANAQVLGAALRLLLWTGKLTPMQASNQ